MSEERLGADTRALDRALEHARAYLASLDSAPVAAGASLHELRRRFCRPLPEHGAAAHEVVDDLVRCAEDGLLRSSGGRFFAWVVGGGVPAAVAADWLTSIWDQNIALFVSGPAAAVAEEATAAWLKELLGLPAPAGVAFVTGAQMATFTSLAAARNELLHRRGWNVEQRGLAGAPPIRVLCGPERHGSIARAARMLGLGTDALVEIADDALGRIDPTALGRALAANGATGTIVALQAGQINSGAYDDFARLVPLARGHDAWVHVDGAFGLWATVSKRYGELLRGVEAADSWSVDGHKWLNVPYDSGYAIVADPLPLRRAMSQQESYLTHSEQARDPLDWTPEWSRRARGFATWAAICQLGRTGIVELVERTCEQAAALVAGIGDLPGAEVVVAPQINQGLVRFVDPSPGAGPGDHDRRTDAVIEALVREGTAFFQGTAWRGRRCMRVSVCNWRTRDEDVVRTIAAVRRCIEALSSPATG